MRPSNFGASGRGPPGPALGTALMLPMKITVKLKNTMKAANVIVVIVFNHFL